MNVQNTQTAFDAAMKIIRETGKRTANAMAIAREYMASEGAIVGACKAMTTLDSEYSALPKGKRGDSVLKIGIRAFYKNMSTAVSHERAALKAELNDETAEKAALYARFPFRILREKGCYIVVTHAEFDAATVNRRKSADGGADNGEGAAETGEGGDKGIDKAAQALAALQSALDTMTADRDMWMARALLAEPIVEDAKKPVRAAKKRTTAKRKAA